MKFHYQILSQEQRKILTFIDKFKKDYFLVGGTAIALQLGHRQSIDFDLFIPNKESLDIRTINLYLKKTGYDFQVLEEKDFHYEILLNGVKITFFAYIYDIPIDRRVEGDNFKTVDLLHLAAMKAHAIGKRAKWKDYVDMYFLIKEFGLEKIGDYAKSFFGGKFNKKIFYSQLSYFEDIDYSENIVFMDDFSKPPDRIKTFLLKESKKLI